MKKKIINLLQYYYHCSFLDSSSDAIYSQSDRSNTIKFNTDISNRDPQKLNEDEIELFKDFKKNKKKSDSYWYGYLFFKSKINRVTVFRPLIYGLFNAEEYRLEDDYPKINFVVLREYFDLKNEEIKKIVEKLELDNENDHNSYLDILNKLIHFEPQLNNIIKDDKNIYDIFGIIASESSLYTMGLEKEYKNLLRLLAKDISILQGSCLEDLLIDDLNKESSKTQVNNTFFEPFNLDNHQKDAVKSALNNKVTIITGPPGTGKSQVVSSIIVNAVMNNKNILFASKNNQAIDVVNERINREFMVEYPFIFRLGSSVDESSFLDWINKIYNCIQDTSKGIELKSIEHEISNKLGQKKIIKRKIHETARQRKYFQEYILKHKKSGSVNYLNHIKSTKCIKKAHLLNPSYNITANYYYLLKQIQNQDNLVELSEEDYTNKEELNTLYKKYIKKWQELYPFFISLKDKKALGSFISIKEQLLARNLTLKSYKELSNKIETLIPIVTKILRAWSVTNLSISNRIPLVPKLFDYLIIDEASQNDIASAIPLLFRCKKAIIIGDPNQLQHISRLETKESLEYLNKFDLKGIKWHSFEYTKNSLYRLYANLFPANLVMLKNHYRSHEHIINFSNKLWYKGELNVSTDYFKLKIKEDAKCIKWISISGRIEKLNKSYINNDEANAIVKNISKQFTNKISIGIVTPYRGQANLITNKLRRALGEETFLSSNITVNTIHGFQGEEKDFMYFSLVVSDTQNKKKTILNEQMLFFYREQKNLINVALTRARKKLYLIGNKNFCQNCNADILNKLVLYYDDIYKPKTSSLVESNEEKLLFEEMGRNGIKAIPQYKFNQYRLDFAILIDDDKICIEVDGKQHKRGFIPNTESLIKYDLMRNQMLFYYGWKVLRFWTYEIRDNIDACISKIQTTISNRDQTVSV